jgi:hypothetical protein
MFHALLELPYVHYWLPGLVAVVIGLPVYWFARRSPRLVEETTVSPSGPAVEEDPFTKGSTSEQRKAHRRKGNPIEVMITPKDEPSFTARGYVLDRSISGLRLMLAHEVAPGSVLSVRPANVSPMIPWVEIEVRNCAPSTTQPGEFDIGCKFVKAPPYPVLLLFG